MDWPAKHSPDGCIVTVGTACMDGSAMYLMGTGAPYSQTRIFLSSDVVTMRRDASTKVTVLTASRW